jgi:NADH pyrophosphatase NudC (nudix superfamily)
MAAGLADLAQRHVSALAGFLEPRESIEEACARDLHEA